MDFKKFASGAETLFNRAKQFTEEKLGQTEKTEYEPAFVILMENAEKTKTWTEKIIKDTEALITPNPSYRMEDLLCEKMAAYKPTHLSEVETLGRTMLEAATDLGTATPFATSLTKYGESHIQLAEAQKSFEEKTVKEFLLPLKTFIDTEISNACREKKTLELKRLDLDVAKGKYKKVTTPGKEADQAALAKADVEMKAVQAEFDQQLEITKTTLDAVCASHAHLDTLLKCFIVFQCEYYKSCAEVAEQAAILAK